MEGLRTIARTIAWALIPLTMACTLAGCGTSGSDQTASTTSHQLNGFHGYLYNWTDANGSPMIAFLQWLESNGSISNGQLYTTSFWEGQKTQRPIQQQFQFTGIDSDSGLSLSVGVSGSLTSIVGTISSGNHLTITMPWDLFSGYGSGSGQMTIGPATMQDYTQAVKFAQMEASGELHPGCSGECNAGTMFAIATATALAADAQATATTQMQASQ